VEGKPGFCKMRNIRCKPMTLVAAMINVAITGLYVETIAEGMCQKAWRESQITVIQNQLQQINLLPFVEQAFEGERVAVCQTFETTRRAELLKIFSFGETKSVWQRITNPVFWLLTVAPRGWVYQNMVTDATTMQRKLDGHDLSNGLVWPQKVNQAGKEIETLSPSGPYTFLASVAIPNFIKATQTACGNQTKVNQACLACALERYRLAHGEYPASLDVLAPQFIAKVPHDIIGGQPLKYRRTDDGQFVLYSIGWNERDDGGVPGKTLPVGYDEDQGDWVWQYPSKPGQNNGARK